MKQKFTFLMAAMMLLLTLFIQPGIVRGQSYKKVTSAPSDWSGEYLIVYESGNTAYAWTGVEAASCYATASISNNIITKPDNAQTVTIASMTGGYSIKVNGGTNNGKYIYGTDGSNVLNFSTTEQLNTISYSSNNVDIVSNSSHIRYNSASNQKRFRYFKSSSYTNQQAVQLYERLYTITISNSIENGSVAATIGSDAASSATSGTTITLTATPAGGYDFVSFTVTDSESCDVPVTTVNNTGTFVMPSKNVTVSATFESSGTITHTIAQNTAPATAHGTITFSPESPIAEDTEVTLTATPADGYDFEANSWLVYKQSGESWVEDDDVTVTNNKLIMPHYDIKVDGTFTEKTKYNITVASGIENGSVSANLSQAYEGQIVTLTVTPATGYSLKTLTYTPAGGDPVAIANNAFSMPASAVTVNAEFEKKEAVTYDFSEIDGFSSWGTSYSQHVVTYDEATVTFESANHQTGTITDIPVTTGKYVAIVMKDGEPDMTGVKFVCRQWGTKAQTITLHYSTNGGSSYTSTGITSTNFTIEEKALPAGTNAVKITFSSSSNQVGIASATLTFTADPTLSINPTSLTGFYYTVDNNDDPSENQPFTVAGNYLEDDVTVALPSTSSFEITDNAGNDDSWTNSLTLSPTSGTLSSTTIYVRMKAGLEIHDYSEDITITSGDLSETVSLSGTVDPEPVMITYNLVTSVTPGKHYIVVSTNNDGDYFALGGQNIKDFRAGIGISATSTSTTIASNAGVSEIVISGYANNYTLHVNDGDGYLTMTGDKKLNNTGTASSVWSIGFNGNNAEIHPSTGSYTGYDLQFNYNGGTDPRFTGYTSTQRPIFLYEKYSDVALEIYSNTTIATTTSLSSSNTMTVKPGATLTFTGSVSCSNASWLVVEDGGQLVIPSAGSKEDVKATFQKEITKYITDEKDYYYLIANPTTGNINPTTVAGMLSPNYDLYYFDGSEEVAVWRNYKQGAFNLFSGKGYLYANSSNLTLEFPGTVHPGTTDTIILSKKGSGTYAGFNLVGNKLSNNITDMTIGGIGCNYYKLDSEGSFVPSTADIIVGEAFMVEAPNDKDVLTLNPAKKDEDGFTNEVIRLEVSNSRFTDVAFVYFGNHLPLTKINHLNDEAPKLYIHNENSDKAVEVYNNRGEVKSINVNFEAKTMGAYTISAKMVKGEIKYMHLYDRLTGIDTDLLIDDYSFIGAKEDQPGRFILSLEATDNEFEGSENFAYQSGNNIIVSGEGELQVFDVTGRIVMRQNINGVQAVNGLNNGVYIFKLEGKTQKIVVR